MYCVVALPCDGAVPEVGDGANLANFRAQINKIGKMEHLCNRATPSTKGKMVYVP